MPQPNPTPEEPICGMDYGTPPRYMLMANFAILDLWNQAKCLGLGYLTLPKSGAFSKVPGVGIIFEDIEKGIRVFNLLKSWDCEPGSGRGTDVSFIENRQANSYTLALGPNMEEMIKRLLDPSIPEDYSLMGTTLTVGKTLTLSEHFRWLRDQPRDKPIVLAPGTRSGEMLLQHALTKSDVQFFDRDKLPKETIEYVMTAEEECQERERSKPLPIDPVVIAEKRTRQLKKFFAVAKARLEHNLTFIQATKSLSHKYERWQLVQAACNILCGDWHPKSRTADGKLNFHTAYEDLRKHPESVLDQLALRKEFTSESIEAQIAEDVAYLCGHVRPETKGENPVLALQQLGLLR